MSNSVFKSYEKQFPFLRTSSISFSGHTQNSQTNKYSLDVIKTKVTSNTIAFIYTMMGWGNSSAKIK